MSVCSLEGSSKVSKSLNIIPLYLSLSSSYLASSSFLPILGLANLNSLNSLLKSSRTIYENEVLVKVPAGECNVSMNPSLRKPKSEKIQPQFTGSGFKPYITTVGLYDDDAQLLAVAKLARPIQKREDIDMNFLIRWDY